MTVVDQQIYIRPEQVFLCELDDNLFAVTMPKEVQARVMAKSRSAQLEEAETKVFQRSKNVLVGSVTVFLPICLAAYGNGATFFQAIVQTMWLAWFAFVPCEITQIVGSSTTKSAPQVAVLIALELLKALVMPLIWIVLVALIIPD